MKGYLRPQPAQSLHGLTELQPERVGMRKMAAEFCGMGRLMRGSRCPNERLGGNAAVCQAISAQEMTFNQGDSRAQAGGARGRNQPSRTAANDDQVIAALGLGIFPFGWM